MDVSSLHFLLPWIQKAISLCGVFVIFLGVLFALIRYLKYLFLENDTVKGTEINEIRLRLSRVLTLGLEFIVAADLIGTTMAPDYYTVGIVASIVLIRTVLSFTLNREIKMLSDEKVAVVDKV